MVLIYESDAFAKLTAVEGVQWAKSQKGAYSFLAFLAEYNEIQKALKAEGGGSYTENINSGEFCEAYGRGDGTIYGAGGYTRYIVRGSGEIILLDRSTPLVGKKEVAKKQGFRILR